MRQGIFLILILTFISGYAYTHITEHPSAETKDFQRVAHHETAESALQTPPTSGQGALKFKVLYTRDHFPAEVVNAIDNAHGGFDVDRREGKGETYFALPDVGIIQISADLKTTRLIETPAVLKKANAHYTTVWTLPDELGTTYLSFPANDVGKIFTTTLDGKLVHTLEAPDTMTDFKHPTVNTYFSEGGKFVPTGIAFIFPKFYVTTGYSDLDYILGAQLTNLEPLEVNWYPLAFGGKGDEPGQFGTGHHITMPHGRSDQLDISDRANAEIERYSPDGTYLETLPLIKGSFPCSIDYETGYAVPHTFITGIGMIYDETGYAVVACLYGPDKEKGAPLYILEGHNLVSTVMVKEDLGLETFQHLHSAVIRKIDGKLYIIAQSWNPGDIVILEQVM